MHFFTVTNSLRVRISWRVKSVVSKSFIVIVDGVGLYGDTGETLYRIVLRARHCESDLTVSRRFQGTINSREEFR